MNLMKKDCISTLPLELLSLIFSYIPGEVLLEYLFVSKVFYYTITFPGSIPSLDISFLHDFFSRTEKGLRDNKEFYLNVISKRSQNVIRKVNVVDVTISHQNLLWLMENYKVDELYLPRHVGDIFDPCKVGQFINQIENTSMKYVKSLRVGFGSGISLDLNEFDRLVRIIPNLEELQIEVSSVSSGMYSGKVLSNLKVLKIYADVNVGNSFDNSLQSILVHTPNLQKLGLKVSIVEGKLVKSIDLINGLKYLKYLNYEVSFRENLYIPEFNGHHLSDVSFNTNMKLKSDQNYHLNTDSFSIKGNYIINGLKFYSQKLTRLKMVYDSEYKIYADTIYKACERCPNIEELEVNLWRPSIEWVVIISTKCTKLRSICIKGLEEGYNISKLAGCGIKYIYIEERLNDNDVEWLLMNGFDIVYETLMKEYRGESII